MIFMLQGLKNMYASKRKSLTIIECTVFEYFLNQRRVKSPVFLDTQTVCCDQLKIQTKRSVQKVKME